MEYFERILTHYIVLALERSGVNVDDDTYAELAAAFAEIKEMADTVSDLESESAQRETLAIWTPSTE